MTDELRDNLGTQDDASAEDQQKTVESTQKKADIKSGEGEGDKDTGKPSEQEAKLIRDLMKWKEKARSYEEQVNASSEKLTTYQEVVGDLDLEEVKELVQAKKAAEEEQLKREGEFERLQERMKQEFETKQTAAQGQIADLQSALEAASAQIEELTVGNAFASSEFIREESTLPSSIARTTFGAHFEHKDGNIVGYDKPRGAQERTPIVDENGKPKPFDQALAELYNTHPDAKTLLRSKRKPGANSDSEPGGKGSPAVSESDKGVQRISSILSKQGVVSN